MINTNNTFLATGNQSIVQPMPMYYARCEGTLGGTSSSSNSDPIQLHFHNKADQTTLPHSLASNYTFSGISNTNNRKHLKFRTCKDSRCLTCPCISPKNISNDEHLPFACKANNCIYHLQCSLCNLSYIGQTSGPLHLRINNHRNDIKKYSKNPTSYNAEFDHFSTHPFSKVIISILDIVVSQEDRLIKENNYMLIYKTIIPFGLNDTFNHTQINHSNCNTSKLFHTSQHKTSRGKRGGRKKRSHDILNFQDIIFNLEANFLLNFSWKAIKIFIFSLNKRNLFNFFNSLNTITFKNTHFKILVFDLLKHRTSKMIAPIKEDKRFFTFDFLHPSYDHFNFHDTISQLSNSFPIKDIKISKAFKYITPFGRTIFNYNDFCSKLNSHRNSINCCCNDTHFNNFVDEHHKHIITGNLGLIEDQQLRDILSNGTKFRPIFRKKIEHYKQSFLNNIDNFILKLSYHYNTPLEQFTMWKWSLYKHFQTYIDNNYHNFLFSQYDQQQISLAVKNLQKNFIITPVDKASNNYAFICKKFYLSLLDNELNSSNTYKLSKLDYSSACKKIIAFNKYFNINNSCIKFPYITITPKFHKTPLAFRFITCGSNTYINKPGNIFFNLLTKLYNFIVGEGFTWIINNNKPVLEYLHNNNIHSIDTFDFKDLFSSLPLFHLKDVLTAYYNDYNSILNIDLEYWDKLINFCIFNNFIFNGEQIYQQVDGIPQGSSFSTILANLFLHWFEKHYTLHNFSAFRFVDDLIIFDQPDFIHLWQKIYPAELQLKKTNSSTNSLQFLDIDIHITDNSANTNIYDKRNDFDFEVIRFTPWNSNISIKVFRNIIINHLHRINLICNIITYKNSLKEDFYHTLIQNKFPPQFIKKYLQ